MVIDRLSLLIYFNETNGLMLEEPARFIERPLTKEDFEAMADVGQNKDICKQGFYYRLVVFVNTHTY
jgi:hypothetical protein